MRISELITEEEIIKWEKKDIITISAETGKGKSYFIKNVLYEVAKECDYKILFLINRSRCKEQFENELNEDGKVDVIELATYQKLEYVKDFELNKYDFIVCDEFHYFIADSEFNYKTDTSFNKIIKAGGRKIFMSATGDLMTKYLEEYRNLTIKKYNIKADYSWINLNFYNRTEMIEEVLNGVIENKKKALVFMDSCEKLFNLYQKYKPKSVFCCSSNNSKYYKYVDSNKIGEILQNERFEEELFFTTKCLDNGINIIDDDINTIICDIKDVSTLIQCLGRKRRKEGEKVNVYIKNINNNILGGELARLHKALDMVVDFKKKDINVWTEKYSKSNNEFYNTLFFDEGTKKFINELKQFYIFDRILFIRCCIGDQEKISGMGYKEYMADIFEKKEKYIDLDEKKDKMELETYLKTIVGKKLDKIGRVELINRVDVRVDGHQKKSYDHINKGLVILKLPYRITSKRITKEGKKQTVWIVNKF